MECTIGSVDCDKTTTTTLTTTTGFEPGPCDDIEYLILDDPNRNIQSGDGSTNYDSCDNLYNDGPNYDWRGHSWVGFIYTFRYSLLFTSPILE